MAMQAYGIAQLSLCISMNAMVPGALQPWYADDATSVGTAADNTRCLAFLVENGPKCGYHPQPEKSWYVCKAEDGAVAKEEFEKLDLPIRVTRGQRYLGGFVVSDEEKVAWLHESCRKWASAVGTFAKLADRWPQTVYAGLNFILQNQWQYVQRVVMGPGI